MRTMFSCLSIISFSRNFRVFCVSTNVRKFKSYEDRLTDIRDNTRIICKFLFSHSRKSGLSSEVCAVRTPVDKQDEGQKLAKYYSGPFIVTDLLPYNRVQMKNLQTEVMYPHPLHISRPR